MVTERPKTAFSDHTDDAPKSWKHAFQEFMGRTTFHGWRYIAEPSPFTLRRIVWFLLCAAGFGGFTYQIIDRASYYYEYPVTVNVNVEYNTTLKFPAVTICNLNSFRISKANSLGHYDIINAMFDPGLTSGQKVSTINNLNGGRISLYDLYKQSAHLKEDIIVSWGLKLYNSDLIFCIGSENGLNLIINIEQYEYMRGPNSGAGLKLLVHDPDEFPLVKDLGQAVSPGTHAFMGLQVRQESSLSHPYGNCTSTKTLEYFSVYSMTACRIDCETRWVVKKCNCKDIDMPQKGPNNPPTCDIETYYNCLIPALEEYERVEKEKCNCPTPCDRTLYAPNLSYGTTSSFDTQLFLRQVDTAALEERFINARESMNRRLPEFIQLDKTLITSFTSSVTTVRYVIMTSLAGVINKIEHDLIELTNTTNRIYALQRHALTRMGWSFEQYFYSGVEVRYSETIAQVAPGYSTMFETFETRLNELLTFNDTAYRKVFHGVVTHDMLARKVLAEKADVALKTIYNAYKFMQPLNTNVSSSESYEADSAAFPTYYINEDFTALTTRHQITLTDLENFKSSVEQLMAIADECQNSRTMNTTLYNSAKVGYIGNAKTFIIDIDKLKNSHYSRPQPILIQLMLDLDSAKDEVLTQIRDMQVTVNILKNDLNRIQTETWPSIETVSNLTASYLTNPNVKKTHVAKRVTSLELEDKVAELSAFITSLKTRSQSTDDNWNKLSYQYKQFWDTILGVAALNPYHTYKGNTAITGTTVSAKNSEITDQFSRLAATHDIRGSIGGNDETLKTALAALKKSYAQFLKENTIDATFVKDNFLEVDIFQEELNVQAITQQEGYEGLACLCDIGGTMGLFAGASLITFCELLDAFLHYGAKTLTNKAKVTDSVQNIQVRPTFKTTESVKVWS
ncbi:uncharacterized protein LOC141915288 [Tubulanus polymorphus]|uniref:uncharacterized protein LOC141915288 n=1 Tax=Tubulanus polymorphus TaxID=672921 RepID=UPI003DA39994